MDWTLEAWIKEEKDKGTPFPENKLWSYIIQLCWGVAYLNMVGVCHMDLKPDNILLKGKNLYVADFGVSKRIDEINK